MCFSSEFFGLPLTTSIHLSIWFQSGIVTTGVPVVITSLRNTSTTPDQYPLPHIHDFGARLAGTKICSKIDLTTAYHQIPVERSEVPKTAINAAFGRFQFVRITYGMKSAAQTFERFMDEVTRGLPFIFIYIHDILLASRADEVYKDRLCLLYERLDEHGPALKPKK